MAFLPAAPPRPSAHPPTFTFGFATPRSCPRRRTRTPPPPNPHAHPSRHAPNAASPHAMSSTPSPNPASPTDVGRDTNATTTTTTTDASPPRSAHAPLRATRWRTRVYGDIGNLKREPYQVPPPGPQELRITVRAIGLNFADVFAVLGLYAVAGDPPFTPGFEVCGVVESVGSGVAPASFVPGDRVAALTLFNGYATALNVAAKRARRLPRGWGFADGAAWSAQAFTAWYALCELAGMRRGGENVDEDDDEAAGGAETHGREKKRVLVHSAAGGVGLKVVEIAQKLGMDAVCTIGREEKRGVLLERGVPASRIVVRPTTGGRGGASGELERQVRENAGGCVDVVIDSVAGATFAGGWALLKKRGHLVVMGSAALMPSDAVSPSLSLARVVGLVRLAWGYVTRPRVDVVAAINENKSVHMFNIGGLFDEDELIQRGFRELERLKVSKALIGRRIPFERADEALRFMQSGRSVGKVVLEVSAEEGGAEKEEEKEEEKDSSA